MPNSKPVAGGYLDSSDHEDNPAADIKQSVPYVPPRVTTGSKSYLGGFQFPSSRASVPPNEKAPAPTPRHASVPLSQHSSANSISSTTRHSTPTPNGIQSRQGTPALTSRGSTVEPTSAVGLSSSDVVNKRLHNISTSRVPSARPNLALERQINELSSSLEEYKDTVEQRQNATDSTLACILSTLQRLESTNSTASPLPLPSSSASSIAPPTPAVRPVFLSNPPATPELIEIVSNVVSGTRGRVGKKKNGADDNSVKEHARVTFYRMLGISASRDVRPYFEDEFGEPDTLPLQFADPETGYCVPFPHWKTVLTKQVPWIPTYILRFRSTIPNNQSSASQTLRGLSDEAIVTLLQDGPFKSCATAWRSMDKTDEEIEIMRSHARRYQRSERKAATRGPYIKTIPALQAPKWDYLAHPGYMSQDESDDEGRLCTKRPEHRAQWTNNLYDAVQVAEQKKARTKSGLHHHRRVELAKLPIPHLKRGAGNAKVTVRIAHCGISKTWRETFPGDFNKYAHLVDAQETTKPNILPFLEQHPALKLETGNDGEIKKEEEGQASEHGLGAEDNSVGMFGSWEVLNYAGDEESGAVLEMIGNQDPLEIDPMLLAEEARDKAAYADVPRDRSSVSPDPNVALPSFRSSEMPPPPPLDSTPAEEEGGTSGEAIVRKRRGRPLGSKNKKPKTGADQA